MKTCLLFTLLFTVFTVSAQTFYPWYDTSTSDTHTAFFQAIGGANTANVTNPNTTTGNSGTGVVDNTFATTNMFVTDASNANSQIKFVLNNAIKQEDISTTVIKIKVYFNDFSELPSNILRVFLRNKVGGASGQIFVSATFLEANAGKWVEYTFDFAGHSGTASQDLYDQVIVIFNPATAGVATYYYDGLYGTTDQEVYLDPEAVLDAGNIWYHNYSPDEFNATTASTTAGSVDDNGDPVGGEFLEQGNAVATPSSNGNSSTLVAKFVKDRSVHSFVQFALPSPLTAEDQASAIFKIRVYAASNSTTTNNNIKLILRDGDVGSTQIAILKEVTVFDKWQEYTFDFSSIPFLATTYDHLFLFFAQPDTDGDAEGNVYYFDAFQGPDLDTPTPVKENSISNLDLFPNPVISKLNVNGEYSSGFIYSINGLLVDQINEYTNSIDLSAYSQGVYLITFTLKDGQTITKKFIKK